MNRIRHETAALRTDEAVVWRLAQRAGSRSVPASRILAGNSSAFGFHRLVLCLFVGCVSVLMLCGCGSNSTPEAAPKPVGQAQVDDRVEVRVAMAEPRQFVRAVELTANLAPRRRTAIVSEIDGVIIGLPPAGHKIDVKINGQRISQVLSADIGIPVRKGDILVELDPHDYELQVKLARAELEKAQRELAELLAWRRSEEIEQLRAAKEAAAARYEQARADFERIKELRSRQAASKSDYDRAAMQLRTAHAALAQAEAALKIAEAGPTPEQLAVAKARVALAEAQLAVAENRLEKTKIRAPYDGVITDRFVDIGDRVSPMPRIEIMELMDTSFLIAEVSVPERYNGRISVGDKVSLWADGLDEPLTGLVALINDKVDVETRAFRVRIAVDNRDKKLKAGQLAFVTLRVRSRPNAVSVPASAIVYDGGQPAVFVLASDDTVKLTQVRVGISNGQLTEVLEGLNKGALVVVEDPKLLADGAKVRVVESVSATAGGKNRLAVGSSELAASESRNGRWQALDR